MISAWATSASASARRPAPSARATADEMPPPIAPADSMPIIMKPGKTSAIPVRASVPRCETHHVSINPVDACASMTSTFGQASLSSVGAIGPVSSISVRAFIGAAAGAGVSAPRPAAFMTVAFMARPPPRTSIETRS